MKRLSLLTFLALCAAGPINGVMQADLDYRSDIDTLDTIAFDYQENAGFEELMEKIPYLFIPIQDVLHKEKRPPIELQKRYIAIVATLTRCTDLLDDDYQDELPPSCEKIKNARPEEVLQARRKHWFQRFL